MQESLYIPSEGAAINKMHDCEELMLTFPPVESFGWAAGHAPRIEQWIIRAARLQARDISVLQLLSRYSYLPLVAPQKPDRYPKADQNSLSAPPDRFGAVFERYGIRR